jgi:hypothetical protein
VLAGAALAVATLAPFHQGLDLGFLAPGAEIMGESRILHPALGAAESLLYGVIIWLLAVGAALWPALSAASARPAVAMSR